MGLLPIIAAGNTKMQSGYNFIAVRKRHFTAVFATRPATG